MSEHEREARRERLAALRRAGVDPYPARVASRTPVSEVRQRFDAQDAEALAAQPETVAVVGRIRAVRSFGNLLFLALVENGVSIQVSAKKKELPIERFAFLRELDVGDFVRVEGPVWRTRTGELTVDAKHAELLAKSLRPLPEKWHGLTDIEARFRHRHLDLLVNEESRRTALLRSRAVSALRSALARRDFLEVETPSLQPLYGGAAARPFTTHHHAYDQDLYLRISDELYLKRLIAGGLDRVYEIGHNFRNEGISRKHNPEFTMMECYQAYADYHDMMELCEALIQEVTLAVRGTLQIEYAGKALDLAGRWPRLSLAEAIERATEIDVLAHPDLAELQQALRRRGLAVAEAPNWAKLVDEIFSEHVEPELLGPIFITDHPIDLSPLAKRSAADPRLAERFEPYLAGMEIGNAFSELNDPDEQRRRLEDQVRAQRDGDSEAHPLDEDYIAVLEYGLPPTGGLGIGVDRLVMILADAPSLREVILFPHLRPETTS